MDKIYHNSDSMHVATTKVYVNSDGYAYADKDCTTKIVAEDLFNMFHEGMSIVDTDVPEEFEGTVVEYKPVSCGIDNNIAGVVYIVNDSSDPTIPKMISAWSAEKTFE